MLVKTEGTKMKEFPGHLGSSPVFGEVRVDHLISFLCCVVGFVCLFPFPVSCVSIVASLWIVHSCMSLRFSLAFIPYVQLWIINHSFKVPIRPDAHDAKR
jgi:hypothetical protein